MPKFQGPGNGATYFQIQEKTSVPRPYLSEMMKDPGKLKQLRTDLTKAYQILKDNALQSSYHPQGYLREVWTHQDACGSGAHSCWKFLPWHRGFLYFHERLLRKLSGNDNFRLPVWDWDRVKIIPPPYDDWSVTPLRCRTPNAKFDDIADECSIKSWLLTKDDIPTSNDPAPQAFGGPHTGVHARTSGFMGDQYTSAADPIFFAHHANIDRFFEQWRQRYAHIWNSQYKKVFGNESFQYFDHMTGKPVLVKATDLVELDLGYSYTEILPLELSEFITWDATSNASIGGKTVWTLRIQDLLVKIKDLYASLASLIESRTGRKELEVIFREFLERHVELVLPVSFQARLSGTSGEYLVGVQASSSSRPIVVGQFATFGDSQNNMPGMSMAELRYTGTVCLTPKLIWELWRQFMPKNDDAQLGFQVFYAPAPANGQGLGGDFPTTDAKPLPLDSIQVRVLTRYLAAEVK